MTTYETTARAIAIARQDTGSTAAEFDYQIATAGIGGPMSPLGNAVYKIANPTTDVTADEADARAARLYDELRPELEAYARRCRQRKYVGWSHSSSGRGIKYAS